MDYLGKRGGFEIGMRELIIGIVLLAVISFLLFKIISGGMYKIFG